MLSSLGPSLLGSATLGIIGRTIGCWAAYRLQHLAAVLSVSLLSARLLVEAVAPAPVAPVNADVVPSRRASSSSTSGALTVEPAVRSPWASTQDPNREGVAWVLALLSLQSQRARGFVLPMGLKVALLPLLGCESLLKRLASRLTAASFDGAGGAGGGGGRSRARSK